MPDPFKAYRTESGRTIEQTLAAYGAKASKSLGKGLYQEAQGILASSLGLVPVDTSALRSSGYVMEPIQEIDMISVYFGYGGPAAKINPKTGQSTDGYALTVHENLEAFHKVGCAKFLELPFDQARRGMPARLAAFIRSDMHGGATSMGDPEGI